MRLFFPKANNSKIKLRSHIIFLLSLILIVVYGNKKLEPIEKIEQKTLNYILALKNYNSVDTINLLHGTGSIAVYLQITYQFFILQKSKFYYLFKANDINVVLDQELLNHQNLKMTQNGAILNNFKQFKFVKIKIKMLEQF